MHHARLAHGQAGLLRVPALRGLPLSLQNACCSGHPPEPVEAAGEPPPNAPRGPTEVGWVRERSSSWYPGEKLLRGYCDEEQEFHLLLEVPGEPQRVPPEAL